MGDNPELRTQFALAARAISQQQQLTQRRIADAGRQAVAGYQIALGSISSWVRSIDWPKITEALVQVGRAISNLMPPNHRALGQDYWPGLRELARAEQLCLAWAPNVELARTLLDADSSTERDAILLEHSQETLEDCRQVIDHLQDVVEAVMSEGFEAEVAKPTTERLLDTGTLLQQAIESVAAGHSASGQALATCVIDTLIGQHIHPEDRRGAHTFLKQAIRGAADQEMVALALGDTLDAVESSFRGVGSWSKEGRSESSSSRYSRHGTIHAVSPSVFSETVALKAVLMATSVLALACSPILPIILGLLSESGNADKSVE